MYAVLEVTAGPHTGRKISLSPGVPVRIGRTSKSDYVVAEDTFLSGAHFYVEWSGQQCVVRDLSSSNGTFLNGARTTESPVYEGDVITAGQSSFALRLNPTEVLPAALPAINLDETRPLPLPMNPHAMPANAPPLPAGPPMQASPPVQPSPPVQAPPPPEPELSPTQRGLLDVLRGLADPIFAVLDSSAAAPLLDAVRSAGGAVEIVSEGNGACIMSMNPESRAALQILEGWGKRWGVYVTSRQQVNVVRNHLRRFQSLLTADGAEFLFRFFNPTLLRGFLPSLNADEAKTFFGPLSAILAEGATPEELVLFMAGPSGVLEKSLPLSAVRASGTLQSGV